MSDSFMIQALFIGVDQRIYLISLRNAKHMSKLYSTDIHMQLTKSEIKHIYTEKVNLCMHTHFYAVMQSIISHQFCSFSVAYYIYMISHLKSESNLCLLLILLPLHCSLFVCCAYLYFTTAAKHRPHLMPELLFS